MKLILPAIFLLIFAGKLTGEPADENIKRVSESLAQLKYSLYKNDIPPFTLIGFTGDAVNRLNNKDLSDMYGNFEALYISAPETDTLLSLLNIFSRRYYLQYGENIYNDLISAHKLKVILFITTVSCECTLKKCNEYEQAFFDFINESDEKPEFLVVDSFNEEKLQAKYGVTFVPVILILDKDNNEITRYTNEDEIKNKIEKFLAERDKNEY